LCRLCITILKWDLFLQKAVWSKHIKVKEKEYFENMEETSVSKEAVNKLFTQLKTKTKFIKRAFIEKLRRKETRQRLRISFIDKTRSKFRIL